MKISKSVFIAFLAFVLGQVIQLIANAVAVATYAYRPVLWCAFVAFATIVLVLLTLVVSSFDGNQGGNHVERKPTHMEIAEQYAKPPENKPAFYGIMPSGDDEIPE